MVKAKLPDVWYCQTTKTLYFSLDLSDYSEKDALNILADYLNLMGEYVDLEMSAYEDEPDYWGFKRPDKRHHHHWMEITNRESNQREFICTECHATKTEPL